MRRRTICTGLLAALTTALGCEVQGYVLVERDTVGWTHDCAVHKDRVYCWGSNSRGQLGLGDTSDRATPTALALAGRWQQVVVGQLHGCARDATGAVACWGANDAGQLGVGTTVASASPVSVPLAAPAAVLAGAFQFTCALLTDGALWCWGQNSEGQLAQSDAPPWTDRSSPVQVGTDRDWTAVAAGQGHGCGIRQPGTLWCWGRNTVGQLGQGAGQSLQIRTPVRVGAESDWTRVYAGQGHTCALRRGGTLWCWGVNNGGQAGLGIADDVVTTPQQVTTATDWTDVAVDTFTSCGLRGSGTLWCWGHNEWGQLGLGDMGGMIDQRVPQQVGTGALWVSAAPRRFHLCATQSDGSLWCAGANDWRQLGLGDFAPRRVLTPVAFPE